MTDAAAAMERRSMGRSPSYPALDLEKAISRVRELYAKDKQFPTPVVSAVRYWGYKGISGPANLTVAALKKFGLVDDEGAKDERKIRVTDLAVRIMNHPNADARQLAIQEAALNPSIHSDMWAQYGLDLPSDENLMWTLTRDQNFTETGARDFVKEYRHTIRFARLGDGNPDGVIEHETDDDEGEPARNFDELDSDVQDQVAARYAMPDQYARQLITGASSDKPTQSYPIPVALKGTPPVVVTGAFPLSASEWTQFMAVLNAMKPVLMATSVEIPGFDRVDEDEVSTS